MCKRMDVQQFFKELEKNPFGNQCVPRFSKEKFEIRQIVPQESLWGGGVRGLMPAKLTTAWQMMENPLMTLAGEGYRLTEVRDQTFELQKEAAVAGALKGNRKLTKVKVGDALSSMKPSLEQTKIVAGVLHALKQIQVVIFDEADKKVWTMPEDLRAWSPGRKTLWVDARCERMLEWPSSEGPESFSGWLQARESEGWSIAWPTAEGTLEEIKAELAKTGIQPRALEPGAKLKKEDWARCLGRTQAIQHLASV
jgi:hypothetical protein